MTAFDCCEAGPYVLPQYAATARVAQLHASPKVDPTTPRTEHEWALPDEVRVTPTRCLDLHDDAVGGEEEQDQRCIHEERIPVDLVDTFIWLKLRGPTHSPPRSLNGRMTTKIKLKKAEMVGTSRVLPVAHHVSGGIRMIVLTGIYT